MAMEGPTSDDWDENNIAPHEAFSILANQDRFEILRTIVEASQDTLPFHELYSRSGFDDSGHFNYHLDKLVGPFLTKTDDKYSLRHSARIAYRLAMGGLFSDRTEAELTTVRETCTHCEADRLGAVYEGDRFWISCADCGRRATAAPFPPRALAYYDTDRMPAAFDRYTMGTVVRAAENVCPWCAAPLTATLESGTDGWPAVDYVIRRECCHCHGWIYTRVHDLVRLHPAVISFYHERGVDIVGSSFWTAEPVMAEQMTVATDAESWTAVVTIRYDGDELTLGLADDMRVSTIEVPPTEVSS